MSFSNKINLFDNNKITLLITMGSLGSSSVNEKMIEALRKIGYKGDITLETNNAAKVPVALIPAVARYAAAIANYFKEEVEK